MLTLELGKLEELEPEHATEAVTGDRILRHARSYVLGHGEERTRLNSISIIDKARVRVHRQSARLRSD